MKQPISVISRSPYFFLWIGSILGTWSLFPYMHDLGIIDHSISFKTLFLLSTAQAAILYGLLLWFSSMLIPKTDLKPFSLSKPWVTIIVPGFFFGTLVALIILLFNRFIFSSSSLSSDYSPSYWAGALASLYGGINEEVLLRLFLFTFIYFLLIKTEKNRIFLLWTATIVSALIFGLGHLPAASKLINLNSFEIFRILFLNGIGGIVFGWLYWSRSFYTASLAHFVTDIFIHALI